MEMKMEEDKSLPEFSIQTPLNPSPPPSIFMISYKPLKLPKAQGSISNSSIRVHLSCPPDYDCSISGLLTDDLETCAPQFQAWLRTCHYDYIDYLMEAKRHKGKYSADESKTDEYSHILITYLTSRNQLSDCCSYFYSEPSISSSSSSSSSPY